jgi:hypothetical protein
MAVGGAPSSGVQYDSIRCLKEGLGQRSLRFEFAVKSIQANIEISRPLMRNYIVHGQRQRTRR